VRSKLPFELSAALLAASIAIACGGKPAPSAPSNTGGGAGSAGAPAPWTAVMRTGATFAFDDRLGDEWGDGKPTPLTASVTDVRQDGDAWIATIAWRLGDQGAPDATSDLPRSIVVAPRGVWFPAEAPASVATLGEPTFPLTGPARVERDGRTDYVEPGRLPGEICYGVGPAGEADECEDVCFSELCVHPAHGLTGGAGLWWPDYAVFSRPDLAK